MPRSLTRAGRLVFAFFSTAWALCLASPVDSQQLATDREAEPRSANTQAELCLCHQTPLGPCGAVGASGELALVGLGSVARVVDLVEPRSPRIIGEVVLPAALTGVAFVGSHAVLCDQVDTFHVVDLADPLGPVVVASIELPGSSHRMAVAGDLVLAAMGRDGLAIVDLSDPTDPDPRSYRLIGDTVSDVVVDRGLAYVASATYGSSAAINGLTILDFTDPVQPEEVGTLRIDEYPSAIEVSGSHVYLSLWEDGLMVVDVSDPSEPQIVTRIPWWMRGTDMAIHGEDLCVSEGNQGLIVFDISDPAEPSGEAVVAIDDWSYQVSISGSHALVAGGQSGMHIIDLESSPGPVEVGSIEGYPWIREVQIVDDRLYVRSDDQLMLYDEAHTGELSELGRFDLTDFYPVRLDVAVDRAFLVAGTASSWNGPSLFVIDTSRPNEPVLLGHSDPMMASIAAMALLDDHVIIGGSYVRSDETYVARMWVFDVSDPASPSQAALIEFDGWVTDIAVSGDLVYVSDGSFDDGGIRIYDFTQPDRPVFIDRFPTIGWAPEEIEIGGEVLFAIDRPDFYVLSLEDPHSPAVVALLGSISNTGMHNLQIDRNRVVIDDFQGLRLIDVRDPTRPTRIGFFPLAADHQSIDVQDGSVYVAAGSSGVQVFESCRSTASRAGGARNRP